MSCHVYFPLTTEPEMPWQQKEHRADDLVGGASLLTETPHSATTQPLMRRRIAYLRRNEVTIDRCNRDD